MLEKKQNNTPSKNCVECCLSNRNSLRFIKLSKAPLSYLLNTLIQLKHNILLKNPFIKVLSFLPLACSVIAEWDPVKVALELPATIPDLTSLLIWPFLHPKVN